MGCDIHAYIEVKVDGDWHLYACCDVARHYGLFARMADVRNTTGVEPIAKPRGFPDDAAFMTRFCRDHDGTNGHSDSWLTGDELQSLEGWLIERDKTQGNKPALFWVHDQFGYCFGNGFGKDSRHAPGVEDVRIVFWFDN